jgi:hypothetical protein
MRRSIIGLCLLAVAVDVPVNLYIADFGNETIRRVDALLPFITTGCGNGILCLSYRLSTC